MPYGYELIIDLSQCDAARFTRAQIDRYFTDLCKVMDMVKCERYWWDDDGVAEEDRQTSPQTQGTSAVQFILTSSIVIHTLDQLGQVFVNVFSCKAFDPEKALQITVAAFQAKHWHHHFLTRG